MLISHEMNFSLDDIPKTNIKAIQNDWLDLTKSDKLNINSMIIEYLILDNPNNHILVHTYWCEEEQVWVVEVRNGIYTATSNTFDIFNKDSFGIKEYKNNEYNVDTLDKYFYDNFKRVTKDVYAYHDFKQALDSRNNMIG